MLQAAGPDTPRDCWFSCVLALAWPDGEHAIYEGRVDGTLHMATARHAGLWL